MLFSTMSWTAVCAWGVRWPCLVSDDFREGLEDVDGGDVGHGKFAKGQAGRAGVHYSLHNVPLAV